MKLCTTSGVLILACLSVCACSLLANPKPTAQTAVIDEGEWGKVYRGGYVAMMQPGWRLHSALSIPSGERAAWFYVYLCNGDTAHCTAIAHAQVRFRAEAGHSYRPHAEEEIHGSNRFWVWIEDGGTRERVSDRIPSESG